MLRDFLDEIEVRGDGVEDAGEVAGGVGREGGDEIGGGEFVIECCCGAEGFEDLTLY